LELGDGSGADGKSIPVRNSAIYHRLWSDRLGVTTLEYGIIAAFFCVSLVAIFSKFGSTVTSLFNSVETGI
jgi:Flp pilus assembly pilin Flp